MSITIGSTEAAQTNTSTAHGIKTANLVKNQQELEGQMALKLIQSANVDNVALPTTASSVHTINIKV